MDHFHSRLTSSKEQLARFAQLLRQRGRSGSRDPAAINRSSVHGVDASPMASPSFFGLPLGHPSPQPADEPELNQAATDRGFVPPRVIPARGEHTHSLIVLHGRGSTADLFAAQFLCAKVSKKASPAKMHSRSSSISTTNGLVVSPTSGDLFLGGCLPGARFIFPTARLLPLARSGDSEISVNQWFDVWDSHDRGLHKEIQYEGIRDSVAFLRWIVEYEARKIGAENVILAGLSQGAAVGLHLLIGLECNEDLKLHQSARKSPNAEENEKAPLALGGAIFMSGWLPLASDIALAALPDETEEFDSRWRSPAEKGLCDGPEGAAQLASEDQDLHTRQYAAANYAREVAQLEALNPSLQRSPGFVHTPVFVGHGRLDDKVPMHMAIRYRDLLVRLGVKVRWKMYEYMHWWKEPEEIDDIARFLKEECGLAVEDI